MNQNLLINLYLKHFSYSGKNRQVCNEMYWLRKMNASQNQEMKQTNVSKVHKMHSSTIYIEQSVVVFSPASAFTTMMEILYCVHVTADKHYRWN